MELSSRNDVIMDIDMEEELSEMVNGGDLYGDGDNARYFDNIMREVESERSRVFLGDHGLEKAGEGEMNYVFDSCLGNYLLR